VGNKAGPPQTEFFLSPTENAREVICWIFWWRFRGRPFTFW